MPPADGGLGTALVGEKLAMGNMNLSVTKLLGEGKQCSETETGLRRLHPKQNQFLVLLNY